MRPSGPAAMLLLLSSGAVYAAGITADLPWGASMARALEVQSGTVIVRVADRLITHDRLEELEVAVTYRFDDDGLAAVSALSRARHPDRNDYIDDFVRLRRWLSARWGAPNVDARAWRNDLFRDQRGRWGDAIAAGHLVYFAEWRAGDTGIVMTLGSERLQVSHELVYRRRPANADAGAGAGPQH